MSSSGISTLPMGRQILRLFSVTTRRNGMKNEGLIRKTNEMIFKTGSTVTRAKYQPRYKASELLNAGPYPLKPVGVPYFLIAASISSGLIH